MSGVAGILWVRIDTGLEPQITSPAVGCGFWHGLIEGGSNLAPRTIIDRLTASIEADAVDALAEIIPDQVLPEQQIEEFGNRSAIIACAIHGSNKSIKYLLDIGATVEGSSATQSTALMGASTYVRTTRLLLQAGADPNAHGTTPVGGVITPLWTCLYHPAGNPKVFRLLLEAGADPYDRNDRGECPAEYASGKFRRELDEFLAADEKP